MSNQLTRRAVLAGAASFAPALALAQQTPANGPQPRPGLATPPSVVTDPPRQWGRHGPPDVYPDPDVLVIDSSFTQCLVRLAGIRRLWSGFQWAEGPAWSGEGNYVVFSDVMGDTQYRYTWESGWVSAYRKPSWNSNGNTFDFQGRQISCQDFFRRVVRWARAIRTSPATAATIRMACSTRRWAITASVWWAA